MSEAAATVPLYWPGLPRAGGAPALQGVLREGVDDFAVDEQLGFAPRAEGPHLLLRLRRRDATTERVVAALAAVFGCKRRDIGYAGVKDRRALVTQWFTVPATPLPRGADFPMAAAARFEQLRERGIAVVEWGFNTRKLRPGSLAGNRFDLCIRQLSHDREAGEARLRQIADGGFPNYFGGQRFGRDGGNLTAAAAWFAGTARAPRKGFLRGMLISAARSAIFNTLLARRVVDGTWDRVLAGDIAMLQGSHSFFPVVAEELAELSGRAVSLDLHPTGPLWGRGAAGVSGAPAAAEKAAAAAWPALRDGLEAIDARADRRALRVVAQDFQWDWQADSLRLAFTLPPGSYATSLVRELID